MNNQTLRLVIPDWQAGNNPTYALGAQILKAIAPANDNQPLPLMSPHKPAIWKRKMGYLPKMSLKKTY